MNSADITWTTEQIANTIETIENWHNDEANKIARSSLSDSEKEKAWAKLGTMREQAIESMQALI